MNTSAGIRKRGELMKKVGEKVFVFGKEGVVQEVFPNASKDIWKSHLYVVKFADGTTREIAESILDDFETSQYFTAKINGHQKSIDEENELEVKNENFDQIINITWYDGSLKSLADALRGGLEDLVGFDKNLRVKVNLHSKLALDKTVLDKIYSAHKNVVINVYYDENDLSARSDYGTQTLNGERARFTGGANSYMYSKEETKVFIENYNYIKKKYNGEMLINHEFSVEMAVDATNKVNDWAEKILSARVDGRSLSAFEKYLMAYQIVSHYGAYKEYPGDTGASRQSRDLVSVLNSDYIVCTGYAKLLTELCVKVGVNCSCQILRGHEICSFDMDDDIYGVHGRFLADPTRNPFVDPKNPADVDLNKAIMTYDYGERAYRTDVFWHNNHFIYSAEEVLGMSMEEYKENRLNQLFAALDAYGEKQYDYLMPINNNLLLSMLSQKLVSGDYKPIFDIFYRTTNMSKSKFKEFIREISKDIEFNSTYYYEQIGEYARKREKGAVMPTIEKLIMAYGKTLGALGIKSKAKRREIIKETIDFSGCDAIIGSYFYGIMAGESVASKAFIKMAGENLESEQL